MILSHEAIIRHLGCGDIGITPFDEQYLGTNSYDVHLAHTIKIPILDQVLDTHNIQDFKWKEVELHRTRGYVLKAGSFCLGSTLEYCRNNAPNIVPMIEGRSTLGRCGLSIHETAGFGDVGFCGQWTLEISPKIPIMIYAEMPIAQLYWLTCEPTLRRYKGRYLEQLGTQEPKDFKNETQG